MTNQLAWARREFRRIVLDKLRELTASEEEFRAEAREILGADVLLRPKKRSSDLIEPT